MKKYAYNKALFTIQYPSFSIIHHPTITSYRNKPNGITTITDTLKIQRMPQSYLSHYIL